MSETQIYKWWWDQTRKRMKKLKNAKSSNVLTTDTKNSQQAAFETSDRDMSKSGEEAIENHNKKIESRLQPISDQPEIATTANHFYSKICESESAAKPFDGLYLNRQQTSELLAASQNFFVPAIDEFGGYSSRLRIPEAMANVEKDNLVKDLKNKSKGLLAKNNEIYEKKPAQQLLIEDHEDSNNAGANVNLCELLGIDVEKIALSIVEKDLASKLEN